MRVGNGPKAPNNPANGHPPQAPNNRANGHPKKAPKNRANGHPSQAQNKTVNNHQPQATNKPVNGHQPQAKNKAVNGHPPPTQDNTVDDEPLQAENKADENSECDCGIASWDTLQPYTERNFVDEAHKHPWMVSIYRNKKTNLCGGALISPTFVLTAAHCFARGKKRKPTDDDETMCIINGNRGPCYRSASEFEVAIYGLDEKLNKRIPAKNIIGHPLYHTLHPEYDIALVELEKPVECGNTTMPVCLPWSIPELKAGTAGVCTGWGKPDKHKIKGKKKNYPLLQEANVEIQSPEDCKKFFKRKSDNATLCAKGVGLAVRGGDSGGPLVISHDGKKYIVGVINFLIGKSKSEFFFSDVKFFRPWIEENMKEENTKEKDMKGKNRKEKNTKEKNTKEEDTEEEDTEEEDTEEEDMEEEEN